jgi:hypothetical protein
MVRVVMQDENPVLGRDLPGRGAWLCPTAACFDAAVKRRAFSRAMRRTVDPEALAELRSRI